MTLNTPNKNQNLKTFFIKLISIVLAIIITINILYNLILSERLEKIDRILLLNNDQYRETIKDKIRKELQDGLEKDNMISVEDKKLLYKIYLKLKDEFKSIEKSQ